MHFFFRVPQYHGGSIEETDDHCNQDTGFCSKPETCENKWNIEKLLVQNVKPGLVAGITQMYCRDYNNQYGDENDFGIHDFLR
jgi:hypothetical protein